MNAEIKKGLYGVVVDETRVSKVMPETNSLTYRGYPVQELCTKASFLEVAHLLLKKELPNENELASFSELEKSQRQISPDLMKIIDLIPQHSHPMDMVRTAISYLALEQTNLEDRSEQNYVSQAISLLAKVPTIIAYLIRKKRNQPLLEPSSSLDFNENFFNMCFAKVPSSTILKAFDVSLILYAEHSFNASTFTARVITSSLSDFYGAVCGGISSLKGPLHGGANEAVMKMLLDINGLENADDWVNKRLEEKKVIMGFGHRVYKSGDSRVPTMKKYYIDVAKELEQEEWVEISNRVEEIILKKKNIHPNLDFPAGPAYYLMGFDIDFFTPLFVMSRITGWAAHIIEQNSDNRLIRPLSHYNGELQREVKEITQR